MSEVTVSSNEQRQRELLGDFELLDSRGPRLVTIGLVKRNLDEQP